MCFKLSQLGYYVYSCHARLDRLWGNTYFHVCPQTCLNEARTNIGLSLTMGFLNENDCLAYFAILGELLSGLSFTVGFLRFKAFSHY